MQTIYGPMKCTRACQMLCTHISQQCQASGGNMSWNVCSVVSNIFVSVEQQSVVLCTFYITCASYNRSETETAICLCSKINVTLLELFFTVKYHCNLRFTSVKHLPLNNTLFCKCYGLFREFCLFVFVSNLYFILNYILIIFTAYSRCMKTCGNVEGQNQR